jgi:DnaK suppressor protein
MTQKELRILTEKLLDARSQLVRKIRRNRYDLRDLADRPVRDSGDRILEFSGKNYLHSECTFHYLNLRRIEEALERIKLGTYGQCLECEKPIGKKRLSAVPWAVFCVTCQEREEMRGLYEFESRSA